MSQEMLQRSGSMETSPDSQQRTRGMEISQEMKRYLSRVKLWMLGMPRKAKKGIIDELYSHIMDSAMAIGGPGMVGSVVAGMESPRKTAKMYRKIYGYGLLFKILFVILTIILSILTVPTWQVFSPDFNTNFWFFLLILLVFFVGSRAGKRMALLVGITAFITRFIILGLIVAAVGKYGIVLGGEMFVFLLASLLLILVAYIPARTIEKWEERKAWDIPIPQPYETRGCPRCGADIPAQSKFCAECGGRVW